jgi:hypothetical protein
MSDRDEERKRIEAWFLSAARDAGVPILAGEVARGEEGKEPDFIIRGSTGSLGIELSEIMRPATGNSDFMPVEEASFHKRVTRMGQQEYSRALGVEPVHVAIYFTKARDKKGDARKMAHALAEFVRTNACCANPGTIFREEETPEGFGYIRITRGTTAWWSGEAGAYTVADIRAQLAQRITAKDKLLQKYRANLPRMPIWLLLYSEVAVARGMSIPHGMEKWKFPFGFERVFWFTALEGQLVEIQRGG